MTTAEVQTVELDVDGMKCGGCSGRLKKALDATEGVQSSTASHTTRKVSVAFDAARLSSKDIRAQIEAAGFSIRA